MTLGSLVALAGTLVALAACSESKKGPAVTSTGAPITAADHAAAKETFAMRCTPCHGTTGAGDGPASATLTPRPRKFQDAKWQDSVDDGHLEKIIVYGGSAVGKAPMMPGNPDLADKTGEVAALRELVRSFRR